MSVDATCIHCGTVGFVRREHVITAKAALTQHYCGACNKSWAVDRDQRSQQLSSETTKTDQPDHSR